MIMLFLKRFFLSQESRINNEYVKAEKNRARWSFICTLFFTAEPPIEDFASFIIFWA